MGAIPVKHTRLFARHTLLHAEGRWPLAAGLLILWMLTSGGAYVLLVRPRGVFFDFYPLWHGARLVLSGINPYSSLITRVTAVAGDPAGTGLLISRFLYPATIAYLLFPFWLMPFELSVSLWNGLQLLLVMVAPLVLFLQLGWRPKPRALAAIMLLSSLMYRHPVNVFVLGQFTLFVLAALMAGCWAIQHRKHWIAAFALAGATIRPEGAILAMWLLLDQLVRRRFGTAARAATVMAAIVGLSYAQIGFWLPQFGSGVHRFQRSGLSSMPLQLVGANVLALISVTLVLLWAGWMVRRLRNLEDRARLPWSLAVAIVAGLTVLPQTNSYTLVYALLPMWLILRVHEGRGWPTMGVFALMASPWLFLLGKQRLGLPSTVEQLVLPLLIGGVLTHAWRCATRARLVQSPERLTPWTATAPA